jgi:flotillin
MELWLIVIALAIIVLVIVGLIALWAARYVKAGPNEVLVISGRQRTIVDETGRRQTVGYRLVRGGTFVWPIKERVQRLSLELLTLDVQVPDAYTAQGVRIMVEGVAQVKVRGDDRSIAIAAEQFLSRSPDDIRRVAHQVVEGHLRAVLGTVSVEDVYLHRDEIARRVRAAAEEDLGRMGLEIVSFTIHELSDSEGYLEALGRPRVAQVKRDAAIGEAKAQQEAEHVRYAAQTEIEAARRDYEIKKATFDADVARHRAEADLAYDLQRFRTAQAVKQEEVKVAIVEKDLLIQLQEKEIQRRERELQATVTRPAEAERQRIELLAQAESYRRRAEGEGEAEALRARGLAEAEVTRAKGLAEAEAMRYKAESWGLYNEAAITEIVVNVLPKLAEAVSAPLAKTDRIVIIGGSDGTVGANRLTRDISDIIAQLPTIVEAISGQKLSELIERAPGLRGAPARADGTSAASASQTAA